jgi:hypothetical protein
MALFMLLHLALGQDLKSISSFVVQVRFVMKDAIQQQLDLGNIVLLNNLGKQIRQQIKSSVLVT